MEYRITTPITPRAHARLESHARLKSNALLLYTHLIKYYEVLLCGQQLLLQ